MGQMYLLQRLNGHNASDIREIGLLSTTGFGLVISVSVGEVNRLFKRSEMTM